jgi:hypothetical protein
MSSIHPPLGLAIVLAALTIAGSSMAFDRESAASALAQVDLTMCRAPKAPRGEGHVKVTFTAEGKATSAVVDRGPMVGTPAAKCIGAQFTKARIPAFKGQPVQVGKLFQFE